MDFLKVVVACICALFIFIFGASMGKEQAQKEKTAKIEKLEQHVMRVYAIRVGTETVEVQADEIRHDAGCILFLRGDRIDTIMCPGMDRIVVTEKN